MRRPFILPLLLALIHCFASGLGAVVVSEAPVVTATENSASLKWGTDTECGTQVRFGVNPNNLNHKAEGDVGVKHQVQLNQLMPGTKYFYTLGTAKKGLQDGSFTTKGTPPKGSPPPAPTEAKPAAKTPPPAAKAKPAAPPPATATPTYTPPPTGKTWGDRGSLPDHFNRHGADFGAKNADDYAAKAWLFLQRAMDEGLPAKLDESDGTIRVWEGKTHTFAAYNRDFTTKTYFKPNSGDYFTRQPGKPVRLRHAPPKS
jgi:hypothetical protein